MIPYYYSTMAINKLLIEERNAIPSLRGLKAKQLSLETDLRASFKNYQNIVDLYEISPEQNKIILSNGGVEQLTIDAIDGEYIKHPNKYKILKHFADKGDPLASKMVELASHSWLGNVNPIIHGTDIPQKLLTRTMTEKEYDGYLNGKIPVSSFQFERGGERTLYYIPQVEKPIEKSAPVPGLKRIATYFSKK